MNASTYTIVAFILGLGVLWGYALSLWFTGRALARRERRRTRSQAR